MSCAFAAVIAARAAQVLLHDVVDDVSSVSSGLHAVGQGEREVHVQARSGRELSDLADSANTMIRTLRSDVEPANFTARLGLYSMDNGSPLAAGTWAAAKAGADAAASAAALQSIYTSLKFFR